MSLSECMSPHKASLQIVVLWTWSKTNINTACVSYSYMLLVNSNSIVQLYAYGTNSHTIRVRLSICVYAYGMYHTRIRYDIRVWYTTTLSLISVTPRHVVHTNLRLFVACQKPSTANYRPPESRDLQNKTDIDCSPDSFFRWHKYEKKKTV